jgi:hypothetical protein
MTAGRLVLPPLKIGLTGQGVTSHKNSQRILPQEIVNKIQVVAVHGPARRVPKCGLVLGDG